MSDLPQKLLGHPRLLSGESLASFLIRLGKANFYQPPGILTDLIFDGIDTCASLREWVNLPRRAALFERIACLAQIEYLQIYKASAHRFAQVLAPPGSEISTLELPDNQVIPLLSKGAAQKQFRSTSACLYCPACVQQHPYHRLIWCLVATSACIEHKCLLTSQCYNCNRPIRVQDVVNAYCDQCGVDLGKAPRIDISEDEFGLFSQQIIQAWLLDTPVSLPSSDYLPPHPSNVLFCVVEGLRFTAQRLARSGWAYLYTSRAHHDTLAMPFKADSHALTPYQSFCVYTTAFKGVVDWPRGFHEFLDGQYDKAEGGGKLRQDFGNMYTHWLQRKWEHAAFNFVQDAFNLYITEHYGISLSILHSDRFRRSPEALRKFSLVSINYAAELAGVTPVTIERLIHSGQLETTKGNPSFVRQADVLGLRDSWNFFMGLEEATGTLGVSEEVVLGMVDIGLLPSEQSPSAGFSSWKFREKSLCQLLDNIKKHAVIHKEVDGVNGPALNLAGAARILTHIGLNAASIIALVVDGKLQTYREPNLPFSCKDLLFDLRDICTYGKTVLTERGWLSRKEVTVLLKIKDAMLTKWVRTGLLTPVTIYVNAQYFDKDAVAKFEASHITSEEAAKLLGIGVLTVQKWTRQGRLQAVSGPGVDEQHDYLFNKETLLRWSDGRLSFGEAVDILGVSAATLHRWANAGKITPLEDMGEKQRWFSRKAVLELRSEIEQKFAVTTKA